MARGLQVTMILFGAILVIEGLLDLALPVHRAAGMGLADCAASAGLPMALLGASWVAAGGWILVGATNPRAHPDTVRFARMVPLALLVALVVASARGAVSFADVAVDIGFDVLFLGLFAVFRPRGEP